MSGFFQMMMAIPPPFNMIVLIVLICTIGGILTSAGKQIRKFACHRQELEFKRELLDRGLSADEVERVIKAKSSDSGSGDSV